jgi:hypothetical protein
LTAIELRKWHRDGWGEWLPTTDQRVPAMVALLAIARHERGCPEDVVEWWGERWQWRPRPQEGGAG